MRLHKVLFTLALRYIPGGEIDALAQARYQVYIFLY